MMICEIKRMLTRVTGTKSIQEKLFLNILSLPHFRITCTSFYDLWENAMIVGRDLNPGQMEISPAKPVFFLSFSV